MEDADILSRYNRDECSLDDLIKHCRSGNDIEHLAAQSKDPLLRNTVLYVLYEIGKAAGDQWRVGFSWISDANPDTAYLALGLIGAHGASRHARRDGLSLIYDTCRRTTLGC